MAGVHTSGACDLYPSEESYARSDPKRQCEGVNLTSRTNYSV